jgi:hypothetical protein
LVSLPFGILNCSGNVELKNRTFSVGGGEESETAWIGPDGYNHEEHHQDQSKERKYQIIFKNLAFHTFEGNKLAHGGWV